MYQNEKECLMVLVKLLHLSVYKQLRLRLRTCMWTDFVDRIVYCHATNINETSTNIDDNDIHCILALSLKSMRNCSRPCLINSEQSEVPTRVLVALNTWFPKFLKSCSQPLEQHRPVETCLKTSTLVALHWCHIYMAMYLTVVLMYLSIKLFFERSLHWWSHKTVLTTRNLIIKFDHC